MKKNRNQYIIQPAAEVVLMRGLAADLKKVKTASS
jgi:hypothetical protein